MCASRRTETGHAVGTVVYIYRSQTWLCDLFHHPVEDVTCAGADDGANASKKDRSGAATFPTAAVGAVVPAPWNALPNYK